MKTILTLFTTALLVSCSARKEFYTVCPVEVPRAWKKAPSGGLQYRKLKKGLYGCNNGECRVLFADWQFVVENMTKCDHARQALIDLFEGLSTPVKRDDVGDAERLDDINRTPVEKLMEPEVGWDNVPIVDPR